MQSSGLKRAAFAGALLAAAAFTVIAFRHIERAPLGWSAAAWAAVACVGWFSGALGKRRAMWLNTAAVFMAIAFGETFLWVRTTAPAIFGPDFSHEGSYYTPNFYIRPEGTLGYRPRPGVSGHAIKKFRGQVLYDVTYQVGADGLRRSPPAVDDPDGCVLFFGDSVAWGEGVNDTETAAYQLGLSMQGKQRVYNFAVTGYSAHQLAAAADQSLVKQSIQCDPNEPVLVVYEVLPNNVARAAGIGLWDAYGPRYVISRSGELVRRGYFSRGDYILGDKVFVPAKTLKYANKSMLYSYLFGQRRRPTDFDLQRFVKIVGHARDVLKEQIPRANLLVILWYDMDEDHGFGPRTRAVQDALQSVGLDVRNIGQVIPGYDEKPLAYQIPNDGHPTPEAHRLVAEYLKRQIEQGMPVTRAAFQR